MEIGFHSDVTNPWYWRWICKLFGKKEYHTVVVGELKLLKSYLERIPHRDCADCKDEFEPLDSMDWWCKACLIKRYETLRPKPRTEIVGKEPELTDSGPGGS
jgi:hypothetical protein